MASGPCSQNPWQPVRRSCTLSLSPWRSISSAMASATGRQPQARQAVPAHMVSVSSYDPRSFASSSRSDSNAAMLSSLGIGAHLDLGRARPAGDIVARRVVAGSL